MVLVINNCTTTSPASASATSRSVKCFLKYVLVFTDPTTPIAAAAATSAVKGFC